VPLPYAIREGLAGFRRAPIAAFAATSAMVVALVLIGVFLFVLIEGARVTEYLRDRIGTVEVFLTPDADSLDAVVLTSRLGVQQEVVSVQYISPAQAQREFAQDFGQDAALFGENFLPASIRVTVRPAYANPDSIARLAMRIRPMRGVDDVVYDRGLLARVQSNLGLLRTGGFIVVLFVVIGALFLVANTIRLTIYARRLLIRTMKLVGATDRFIQRPFLVEGLVQGLTAGLVAVLVLWGLGALPASVFAGRSALLASLPLVAALVLGLVIGWAGTYVALRRFIRRVALH
jgi:cell division transport system permease protein